MSTNGSNPRCRSSSSNSVQFVAPAPLLQKRENRLSQIAEFFRRFLPRLALRLVDGLQDFLPLALRYLFRSQEIGPKFAVADPHHHVFLGQPEAAKISINRTNQFRVGGQWKSRLRCRS